jgi:quercetin dioxygenase-like cupin family protein
MKKALSILTVLVAVIFLSNNCFAQDAAEVDPEHYKVEFENDQVRVLRITYGPNEKSKMHSHPEGVVVFLTDGTGMFTYPDGSTEDMSFNTGLVIWTPGITHQPENTGDEPFEVIQIEMKK